MTVDEVETKPFESLMENYMNGNRKDAAKQFHDLGYDDVSEFIEEAREAMGPKETLEMLRVIYRIMSTW